MNENLIAYVLAYLIGAIPFGLLIGKYFCGVDVKKEGSKSTGATNVLRVLKQKSPKNAKKLAALTLLCDALKGIIPILIARYFLDISFDTQWSMAVLAVVGHCFSIYLKFQGGKGVSTGVGVLLCFIPIEVCIALIVWFIVGKLIKISSLASICGLIALIVSSFIIHADISHINTHAPIWIIAFVIVYKHIPNIKRLFSGNESKVI